MEALHPGCSKTFIQYTHTKLRFSPLHIFRLIKNAQMCFFIVINNKLIAFTNCLSHTIDSMRFSAIGASLRYMIQTIILNINNLTLYLFHSFSRVLPCSHPSQWECSRVKSHQQQYTFRGTEPDSSGASVPPRILHSVHTSAATSLSSTNAGHIVGGIHTLPVQEEVSMFLHNTPADTHTHTH